MSKQFREALKLLTNAAQIQQGRVYWIARYTYRYDYNTRISFADSESQYTPYMHVGKQSGRKINLTTTKTQLRQAIAATTDARFLPLLFSQLLQANTLPATGYWIRTAEKDTILNCYHTAKNNNTKNGYYSNRANAQKAANKAVTDYTPDRSKTPHQYFEELLITISRELCADEACLKSMAQAMVAYQSRLGESIWHLISSQLTAENVARIEPFITALATSDDLHTITRHVLERRDNAGNSPLHAAAANGNLQLLLHLITPLPFVNPDWVQARLSEANDAGLTPWHVMIQAQREDTLTFNDAELEPADGVLDWVVHKTGMMFADFCGEHASTSMAPKANTWLDKEITVQAEVVAEAVPEPQPANTRRRQQTSAKTIVSTASSGNYDRLAKLLANPEVTTQFLATAISQQQLLQAAVKRGNPLILATIVEAIQTPQWVAVGRDCVYHNLPKVFQAQQLLVPALLFGRLIRELSDARYARYATAKATRVDVLKALLTHYSDATGGQPTTVDTFAIPANAFFFVKFKRLAILLCQALNRTSTYRQQRHKLCKYLSGQVDTLLGEPRTAQVVSEADKAEVAGAGGGGGGAARERRPSVNPKYTAAAVTASNTK